MLNKIYLTLIAFYRIISFMLTFKYLIQNNFTITYITYFVLICLVVLVETSILINLKLDNKVNFFKYQVK